MTKVFVRSVMAAAVLATAAPVSAGEVSGNGKDLPLNGRSACKYSGINDTPEGFWIEIGGELVQIDPGGHTQSYGSFNAHYDWFGSPSDPDNRAGAFPAAGCNPNRAGD